MKVSDARQVIPESLWMIGNPDILSKMSGEDIDSIYNALADLMDRERSASSVTAAMNGGRTR